MPDPPGLVVKNGTKRFDAFGRPGPFVVDPEIEHPSVARPADRDAAAGLERRVDGVAQQVDQQLLELIGVGADREVRARRAMRTARRVSTPATRRTSARERAPSRARGAGSFASRA